MAIATIERTELIASQISFKDIPADKYERKIFGRLVSELIAVRRNTDNPNRIVDLAHRLAYFNGIIRDPFSTRRFDITRFIATMNRGMYNNPMVQQ